MISANLYKQIGGRIRRARQAASFSQKKLAEDVGFESATAISLIESGERRVSIEDLKEIARVLKVDFQHLLGGAIEHDISIALRADKNLTKEDEGKIISFIEFVKKNKNA